MKQRVLYCMLAALMLSIIVPVYAQLSEDFGTTTAAWPLPNWSQLIGLYGTNLSPGTQWYQDDWLNISPMANKCAKLNIYGTLRHGWLVTPPVTIPEAGYELKFNLGFVIWNGSTSPAQGAQPDDRFMILISDSPSMTNPTILREYNNTGSQYVLDNIPASGSTVIVPLGNLTGTKYFAFYGESTVLNGDNDLMIDNVLIRPFPTDPSFHYTPASIDFGQVMQNVAISPQALTITNNDAGTLYLNASDFSISGPDASMFSFDPVNLPAALTADQSVIIPIGFTPASEGHKSATLQIVSSQTRTTYQIPLMGNALPLGEVLVGQGSSNLHLPIYPYFGYSYSQSIYLQSELNIPNQRISSIQYYWNGAADANGSNSWTILMGHTSQSSFSSDTAWVPCANLSPVFSGTVNLPPTPGWITITLDNPFPYNNSDNLLIAIDENEAGYNGSNEFFHGTDTTQNRSIMFYSDSTNPDPAAPPSGSRIAGVPNILLHFSPIPSGPPHPVSITNPQNGVQGLPQSGFSLNWIPAATGGTPEHYKVYMANSESAIMSGQYWITTNQCFNPVSEGQLSFALGERWYWTVEAINADGSAVVLPPFWFEIEPLVDSFPYLADFESCTSNSLPIGWSRSSLSLGWKTGSNLSSDYFVIPNHSVYAAANDDAAGANHNGSQDMLIMPRMDFSQSNHIPTLSFDSYFTGEYGQTATVETSADGSTWNVIHNLSPASSWTPLSISLASVAGEELAFIRFHSNDGGVWASGWAIDNVRISINGLDAPELSVQFAQGALQLSWNAVDGASGYKVEASPTPLDESSWMELNTTTGLSYTYAGSVSPLFFRVIALAAR